MVAKVAYVLGLLTFIGAVVWCWVSWVVNKAVQMYEEDPQ